MIFKRVVHHVPFSFPETFQLETTSGKFFEAKTLSVKNADNGLLKVEFEISVLGHVVQHGDMVVGNLLINEMGMLPNGRHLQSVVKLDHLDLSTIPANPIIVSSNPQAYEPVVLENNERHMRVLFLHQLEKCPICKKPMLTLPVTMGRYDENNEDRQMERLGAVHKGGEQACEECVRAGRVTFECELCHEKRSTNLLQWEFSGDGLCMPCFETVSAKVWKEAKDRIKEAHEYDY